MTERERYQRYLCSREWAEKREAVRKRCRGVCERCRYFQMSHVHHLTYVRKYDELPGDLQGLCEGCHEFIHKKSDRDPVQQVVALVASDPYRLLAWCESLGLHMEATIRIDGPTGWMTSEVEFILKASKPQILRAIALSMEAKTAASPEL